MMDDILQIILLMIIFIGILGLAYWATRKIAKWGIHTQKVKNLEIIERLSILPGQTLYIVRVGKVYCLMTGTKEQMTYCKTLDKDTLELEDFKEEKMPNQSSFEATLIEMIKRKTGEFKWKSKE